MIVKQLSLACAPWVLAVALASPSAAGAQLGGGTPAVGTLPANTTAGQDDAPDTSRDIVVTGSLIRGTPEDAALPVDVIGAEELTKAGAPQPVELLKQLPTSSGVLGDSNQFDSRAQGSTGIATVNLRGLSPQRTLVLLNSKRLATAGNGVPSVDINSLPQAAIGRIELLKDGAATIYGSDAVAGVVNFITRTDQEGFLVAGNFRHIRSTDGEFDASVSYGHKGDGFRLLVAAGFTKRPQLLARDRDFAVQDYPVNPQGGWTGGGNPANFVPIGVSVGGVSPIYSDASCQSLGGYIGRPTGRYLQGQCFTQYTPYDALVEFEKRGQVFIDFEADLVDGATFQFTALGGQTLVPRSLTSPSYITTQSPSTVPFQGTPFGALAAASASGYVVPASNPGLIAYRAANPGQIPSAATNVIFPTLLFRPFLAGGNPLFLSDEENSGASQARTSTDRIRLTAEVRGDVTSGIGYNLALTYDDVFRHTSGNDTFGDRLQRALLGFGGFNCTGTTPGANGCLWFNPFGNATTSNPATGDQNAQPAGPTNSPELAAYFFQPTRTNTRTQLFVADAAISGGTGIMLPGGDVKFGVGAQYRKNWFETRLGVNNNIVVTPCRESPLNGNQNPNACAGGASANGAFTFLGSGQERALQGDIYAVFGEVQVPIFDSLNLQLSARYEDYGTGIGSTFDPQARARWQITPWLAVRGGVGTTFRGPTLPDTDPGRVTALSQIGGTFKPQDVFGNPNLSPESSTNYSGGVLLNAGGFSASVDYFRYKLKDAIITDPLGPMVAALFPAGRANTCATNPTLADRFSFTTGNGRAGCLATTDVNAITRVRTDRQNGPQILTQGLDFIANYRTRDLFGSQLRFGTGVTATYVIENSIGPVEVAGVQVQPGYDGVGLLNFQQTLYPVPEWKGQAYVDLGGGPVDARVTVNYTDGLRDQRADNNSGPFAPNAALGGISVRTGENLEEFVTADFNLQVQVTEGLTLIGTVFNIFDADPPFAREDYNYEPFIGNPLGRMYKIGLSARF